MLDFALTRFPLKQRLSDGSETLIRPLQSCDEQVFQGLMLAVPEVERLFIKERMTDPQLIHRWCERIDYQANLPLLAFDGDQPAAVGTLHQRQGGWRRHIGVLSVLIEPRYRGRGLVKLLIDQLVDIARHGGLTKLETEFNGERENVHRAFSAAGFRILVRLPRYVQDMQGGFHDYVLMGRDLVPPEEFLSAGD